MGNYEYFRKIKTNGNLLIFCQTIDLLPVQKWRHTRGGKNLEYLPSKVNFPAKSAI